MIKRKLKNLILSRIQNYPAVALIGPRQVGKTTLAKTLSNIYYDLELEEDKLRLDLQWNNVVSSKKLIILDEAQNFPEIFPRIRSAIDKERKRNGRFLILGSVSPGLMKDVSESLTGRIAICELSPFSVTEFYRNNENDLWLMGGYPDGGVLLKSNFPLWQRNYLDLLTMRDLPQWGIPAKPQVTKRLFKMLAISHGNIWNASQLGKSLGLSYHTVNTYLDLLEQAFLIRRVQPYYVNIKKRLTKSPKIFWRDSGLLHSLININTMEDLIAHPKAGFSWEGWIIEQIIIFLNINDVYYDGPYFLRTSDGYEIDLILVISGQIWTFEIKLTSMPSNQDINRLKIISDMISADKRALISHVKGPAISSNTISGNLKDILEYILQ